MVGHMVSHGHVVSLHNSPSRQRSTKYPCQRNDGYLLQRKATGTPISVVTGTLLVYTKMDIKYKYKILSLKIII